MNTYHIYPLNEEKEHVLKVHWQSCECIPRVKKVYKHGVHIGSIIIHSAFDGREIMEEAEFIKNNCL